MNHEQMASHIQLMGGVPDPDDYNSHRALRAQNCIRDGYSNSLDTPNRHNLRLASWMLCDLMHMCDEEGLSFEQMLQEARDAYALETDAKGPQL